MNHDRRVSQAWIARRERLHQVLGERAESEGNASVLESVGYERRVFSEDEVAAMWAEAAAAPVEGIHHVYVHVPFCKSICHFCNYSRLRPGSSDLFDIWFERMLGSLRTLAPVIRPMQFHTLYFGGGTPSLLPAGMLDELYSAIAEHVPLHPAAARYFEADPAVLDDRKLAVLEKHGVQHVAMGVQTLDAAVNASHDRGTQGADLIGKRVGQLRRAGIQSTSFDFLLGLHDTEPGKLFDEIEQALAQFGPRWVDVFFLTPTQRYVDLHFGGSYEAFWAHQRGFADMAPARLAAICKRQGYDMHGDVYDAFVLTRRATGRLGALPGVSHLVQGMSKRVVAQPDWLGGWPRKMVGWLQTQDSSPYSYTQLVAEQQLPLHLLGIGPGSRTRIYGHAFLTARDPGDEPERRGATEYVGGRTDMGFEARAYLSDVLSLNNRVDVPRLRTLFGDDLHEVLPETLGAWERLGVATLDDKVLALRPTDRQTRFDDLCWLLTDVQIEREILRRRRVDMSPEALTALLAPLKVGEPVSEDWTLGEVVARGLVLHGPDDQTLRVRVAPRLDQTHGLELMPEARGEGTDLARAIPRLRKLLTRNGADKLGITSVPDIHRTAFSGAGQREANARGEGRGTGRRPVPEPAVDVASLAPNPLSEAQVASYWQDGFVSGVPVLSEPEIARFRTWLELIEAEQAARHGGTWDARNFDPDAVPDHPLLDWSMELATHPRLLDAVQSVLGPNLVVRNIDIFVREARTRDGVVWHRDTWKTGDETDKLLTVWLGLNPSTPETGGLRFLRGGHRGLLPGEELSLEALSFTSKTVKAIDAGDVVDNVMSPGQASLHHIRTPHMSGGNRTQGRRIGFVVRFAAGDTRQDVMEAGVVRVARGELSAEGVQARPVVPIMWTV